MEPGFKSFHKGMENKMGVQESLIQDSVSVLDYHQPILVEPSISVREVTESLRLSGRGCVLVMDQNQLIGIFTERDLLLRIMGEGLSPDIPVHQVMTKQPTTVQRTETIAQVIKTMRSGGHRHLPILDETQTPVGVLSVKHIVKYLADHFPQKVYTLPPDPDHAPPTREGA
jgi:CBS domain-containing protein